MNSPYALFTTGDIEDLDLPEPHFIRSTPHGSVITRHEEYIAGVNWKSVNDKVSIHYESKLHPNNLLRDEIVDGFVLKLSDGHDWMMPIIHNIPGSITYSKGSWRNQPDGRYKRLMGLTQDLHDVLDEAILQDEIEDDIPIDRAIEYSIELLKANYWVCDSVVDYMEIFDDLAVVKAVTCGAGWTAERCGMKSITDVIRIGLS